MEGILKWIFHVVVVFLLSSTIQHTASTGRPGNSLSICLFLPFFHKRNPWIEAIEQRRRDIEGGTCLDDKIDLIF